MPHPEVSVGFVTPVTSHRHLETPQAEGQTKTFIFRRVFLHRETKDHNKTER